MSGTFLQALAQDWLVLKLSNSGTILGLILFCQFVPILLFGSHGGLIADRYPKLRILFITQSIAGFLALCLGILVLTDRVEIWMVFVFAFCLGTVNSLDNPTRQSFVSEMVGKDDVKNAVSLWAMLISICKIIGPAIAGILIATVGIGFCFIINAISYIGVLLGMFLIDKNLLHHPEHSPRAKGQIVEGFKYVRNTPILFVPLFLIAIISTISFEWPASLPLFAKFVLNGDAGTYSALSVSLGIGMLLGGIFSAIKAKSDLRHIVYSAFLFGVFLLIASLMTNLVLIFITFVFVGFFSIMFINLSNSTIQINSDPKMRGRVMSLWAMAFLGSTAIGGPFIGWVGEYFGARWSLAVGGITAILAAIYGFASLQKSDKDKRS